MAKRLHIALVVPLLDGGGGVPAVARFVHRTLVNSDYDCTLVSLATSSADSESRRLMQPRKWLTPAGQRSGIWQGRPFIHIGADWSELEFQRYRPRPALARAVAGADLIQVVSGTPAWANAVCGLGQPVSLACATLTEVERRRRDDRPDGPLGWWRKSMTSVSDRFDTRALESVDAIQVMNSRMYARTRDVTTGRTVDVRCAPPGIDTEVFSPAITPAERDSRYILCVGRLDDPRKNIGLLLEAYARIPAAVRRQLSLVLAGQVAPRTSFWLRAEAQGLTDHIRFIPDPPTAELVALYRGATVFVLPSDEEGFGVALVEAMACGVPVVSTRSGGPDDIVTDGYDGFLTPLADAASIAERILRLNDDATLWRTMGTRARMTVERRYSYEQAGRPFQDVWRLLVRTRSAHTSRLAADAAHI